MQKKESRVKIYSKILPRSLPGSYFFCNTKPFNFKFKYALIVEGVRMVVPIAAFAGDYILGEMNGRPLTYLPAITFTTFYYVLSGNLPTMAEYKMLRKPEQPETGSN